VQNRIPVGAPGQVDCDPNAQSYFGVDVESVDGLRDNLDQSTGETDGIVWVADVVHHDRELVTAEPRC